MLSIQPSFNINKPAFGNTLPSAIIPNNPPTGEYTPYVEIPNDSSTGIDTDPMGSKTEFDKTVSGIEQSVRDLADSAKDVPIIQKSTNLFSKLLAILIGWAAMRWGTYGTFKVLSKMGQLKPVSAVTNFVKKHGASVINFAKNNKLTSTLGEKLAKIKDIEFIKKFTSTKFYDKFATVMGSIKGFLKKINPKQAFAETMGVAGGVTAAINNFSSQKPVNGSLQNVEKKSDGSFVVDGEEYPNAA